LAVHLFLCSSVASVPSVGVGEGIFFFIMLRALEDKK
jgi:hypothetical protein